MTDGSPVSTETAAESVILASRQYPQGRHTIHKHPCKSPGRHAGLDPVSIKRGIRILHNPANPDSHKQNTDRIRHSRIHKDDGWFSKDPSWWAMEDSNLRPHACEACALTS